MEISTPFIEAATYGCLYLAAVFLWAPKVDRIQLWVIALGFSLFLGLLGPTLNIVSISVIATIAVVLYFLQNPHYPFLVRLLAGFALLILGMGLIVHRSFGFDNLMVLNKVQVSKNALPFSLYLNYGEAVLGILILGMLHDRITTRQEWFRMLKAMSWRAAIVILVLLGSAYALKYVQYDPKFSKSILLFAVSNLFFVALPEEAFFRGFVQKYLCAMFGEIRFGNGFSIVLAAALFGAAHFSHGWHFVLLTTVAGIGFGWVYYATKRIEASILTHFAVSMIHFIFFTYPALAKPH